MMPSSSIPNREAILRVLKRNNADLRAILARMERGEYDCAIREESRRERAFGRYILQEIDRE